MDDRILALLRRVLQKVESNLKFTKVTNSDSTNVYKIINGKDILYLRIMKDKKEMVSPQVFAHEELLKAGVKVPRFVSWDDDNATLGGSYMIVKEIPGMSLADLKEKNREEYDNCLADVLEEVGEDIARTTFIETKKYGWIKREKRKAKELIGEIDFYKDFLFGNFNKKVSDLEKLGFETFSENDLDKFKMLTYKYIDEVEPNLCHGDFNMNHIYVNNGRYSGIIDWGDIRSASNIYDLAHFTAFHPKNEIQIRSGYERYIKIDDEFEMQLLLTRLGISVNKLWWISKNIPERFADHKLKDSILNDIQILKN